MKLLSELINKTGLTFICQENISRVQVAGIKFDSREIIPGDLFVAVEGDNFDGHSYINDAIINGAVAIVGNKLIQKLSAPYLMVENSRTALAYLSAAFFNFPARHLNMIAVTGTDGKTTTVNLIYKILLACGKKAGMISTVNAVIGDEIIDTGFHVTTPEAPIIQRLLRRMVDNGITHVVLETTSHGLVQQRVSACDIDIAVVTNITHEHFDYHGNYESYFNAKFILIQELAKSYKKPGIKQNIAVINFDDISYRKIIEKLTKDNHDPVHQISYGNHPDNQVRAKNIKPGKNGLEFSVIVKNSEHHVRSSLIGNYNISNIMAAIGATGIGLDLKLNCVIRGIESLENVPGRMEKIDLGQEFLAIVDFAHTPNALKVALETAREMTLGRVIVIFGSAGLRDRQKRRMMAAESIRSADISVFTAEDPRTEKLEDILGEMANEAVQLGGIEKKNFYVIPDRGEAIRSGLRMAQAGDLVIACGKGHEQSMCFGTIEYAWDDRTAMRAALAELLEKSGPLMPYLPTQEIKKTGGS